MGATSGSPSPWMFPGFLATDDPSLYTLVERQVGLPAMSRERSAYVSLTSGGGTVADIGPPEAYPLVGSASARTLFVSGYGRAYVQLDPDPDNNGWAGIEGYFYDSAGGFTEIDPAAGEDRHTAQVAASIMFGIPAPDLPAQPIRVANIFRTVVADTAGDTTIWTPAAGRRFRLMGYAISVAGTVASLGVQTIALSDSSDTFANHLAAVGATVLGDSQLGADLGQGALSQTADDPLVITLGTTMTAGGVAVNVWGTEE